MKFIYQPLSVCAYNYRRWRRNPRIITTFLLAFIVSFLLTGKVLDRALEYNTSIQMFEPFVWTFGDSNSILLISLLLMLLFSDIPFLSAGTPFFLMRTNRKTWLAGQILYIISATFLFLLFILLSTMILCAQSAFPGNVWSKTAATLGYSGDGAGAMLPVLVKTLELSRPFQCTLNIFIMMMLYSLSMVMIMLCFNVAKGQRAGVISVFVFSVFGFVLKPGTIAGVFRLSEDLYYKANVALGWISPLNHATYHMHNFGYDLLPRLWQSYVIFAVLIIAFIFLSFLGIKRYNFNFTGTEG